MAEESLFGNICAVVVTYNIGNGFDTCFNSLRGQVDHAVIVNTSSDDGITSRALERLHESHPEFITLIECPENNLGMAQNMGILEALEQGCDWVLLLDHDSRLEAGMISAMEQAYRAAENRLNIGVITPNRIDAETGQPLEGYLVPQGKYWYARRQFDTLTPVIDNILTVPASGCLVPARVLRQDDLRMDESLILDQIDTDFCLRVRTEGLRIIAVREAKLFPRIGTRKNHRMCGLTLTTVNPLPMRRYYYFRNRVRMWFRHGREWPSYFIADLTATVADMWCIILFEQEKQAKLAAASQGLWDGIRGIRGPRPGTDITRSTARRKPHS